MKTIKDYFRIEEFVCPDVYNRFGEAAWDFLDRDMLEVALFIRVGTGLPMYINNWVWGGDKSQRGLRCNVCPLVKEKTYLEKPYMSAHRFGKGWDFNIKGMTSEEVRTWIKENEIYLPHKIRLELDTPTWTHVDTMQYGMSANKITYFKG